MRIAGTRLAARHGFTVGSLNETLHFAWRRLPDFAAHLTPLIT